MLSQIHFSNLHRQFLGVAFCIELVEFSSHSIFLKHQKALADRNEIFLNLLFQNLILFFEISTPRFMLKRKKMKLQLLWKIVVDQQHKSKE